MIKPETRQKVTILSLKDLEVSYFCGSGAGGQARNKVASGVQMRHLESGAISRASDSRSQYDNKKAAFKRLLKDPRMKFWLSRKIYEIKQGETIEQTVIDETGPNNLKYEIRNQDGKWEEVKEDYFNRDETKKITKL